VILVNLSGRGDKDMDIAMQYFEQDADAARAGGAQK
jgi:tryptophan synthase beta subunit